MAYPYEYPEEPRGLSRGVKLLCVVGIIMLAGGVGAFLLWTANNKPDTQSTHTVQAPMDQETPESFLDATRSPSPSPSSSPSRSPSLSPAPSPSLSTSPSPSPSLSPSRLSPRAKPPSPTERVSSTERALSPREQALVQRQENPNFWCIQSGGVSKNVGVTDPAKMYACPNVVVGYIFTPRKPYVEIQRLQRVEACKLTSGMRPSCSLGYEVQRTDKGWKIYTQRPQNGVAFGIWARWGNTPQAMQTAQFTYAALSGGVTFVTEERSYGQVIVTLFDPNTHRVDKGTYVEKPPFGTTWAALCRQKQQPCR